MSARIESSQAAAGGCGHGAPAMGLEEALHRILAVIAPIPDAESVPLRDALDRVLAEEVRSGINVPGHTNSAMDGYALAAAELPAEGRRSLTLAGTAWAGRPFEGRVAPGQCVRIMTGAPLPEGTDTVVMQEHVTVADQSVTVDAGEEPGQHVRPAGEDIARGEVALGAGTWLEPAQLGLLASLGLGEVRVLRRPRVAFFSTGDELCHVGEAPGPGQIYDSNRYSLFGMLRRLGVEPVDLGVIRDRPEALEEAFRRAARVADAIITSGGVSVGAADFVTETLERVGRVNFWTVAMKPGRPVAFGHIGEALFFGLPGNPVSVMATFYQLVRPALMALAGRPAEPPVTVRARCTTRLRKKSGRREFQRGVLSREGDSYVVASTGHQGAGVLRSMAEANCFIVLAEDEQAVEPGTEVTVQPFAALTR